MAGAKASAAGGAVAAKALVMAGVVAAAAGRAAATEALATVGTKATIEAEVAGVVLSGGWRDQAFCVFCGCSRNFTTQQPGVLVRYMKKKHEIFKS